jgi:hypothetical protein
MAHRRPLRHCLLVAVGTETRVTSIAVNPVRIAPIMVVQ